MDRLRGLVGRYPATALLGRVLVVFALIEVLCRFVILLGFPLLYPIMYVLRLQFEAVMLVIFWNICNEIFDTRKAKRIFPLVTAGGILGRLLGSFSTNLFSRVTSLDNILFISAGLLLLACVASRRIGELFPPPMAVASTEAGAQKGWSSAFSGFKEIGLLAKGSLLFAILAGIRVLPNVVGPLFDFQFSVILDGSFPSESGLIQFYGTFRGVMSIITFVVLLFIGTVYTRVGIPNALLFRPGNYFLVFALLLFRFDIFVGIYARLSISVLTSTLHNPANNILINLFPDEFRAKARPVLQVVARAGSLIGSLILLGLKAFIHASYFSFFGLFFVGLWIFVTLKLRKSYSSFLLESLLEKQVDLGEFKEIDLNVLIQDRVTLDRLLQGLREEKGKASSLCARILSEARYERLSEAILSVIDEKDLAVQVDLLDLLQPDEAPSLVPRLIEMAGTAPSGLRVHLVRAVGRLAPMANVDFLRRMSGSEERDVQAEAVVGLYHGEAGSEGYPLLSRWLESQDPEDRLLAVTTVGRTGEAELTKHLHDSLACEDDPRIQAKALEALGLLESKERNDRVIPFLKSQAPEVRSAAVLALAFDEEVARERAVELLGDESVVVREAAIRRIQGMGREVVPLLLKSLSSPKRKVRDGILRLLEELEVKDVQFSEFITREIHQAYENIYAIQRLKTLNDTPALGLLTQHLEDRNDDSVFTVFRILEVEGEVSKIRTIYNGLKAVAREKANAIEALENTLHPALSRILVPLVEDIPVEEKLKVAEKQLEIMSEKPSDPSDILDACLDSEDTMTQMCALYVMGDGQMERFGERIQPLRDHPDPGVRETARLALQRMGIIEHGGGGEPMLSTMDKIIHLKKVHIFSDLQVRELAAIGSVAVESECPKDEVVVKEGEAGDTMFLIVSGEISVIQNYGTEQETLITTLHPGGYFGEMALFEDEPRSATVTTNGDGHFLVLGKLEFDEIVREFPQIAINICRVFSKRIRETQKKFLA
jgi:HEAT repeat protein/ATP/ADP translocase